MSNVSMTTRFFKVAICRNFEPDVILYELRLKEMPDEEWDDLLSFFGKQEYALENIEQQAAYDIYRWTNWTATQDAKLSVSHIDYPKYYLQDLEDPYEELLASLKASDAEMQ